MDSPPTVNKLSNVQEDQESVYVQPIITYDDISSLYTENGHNEKDVHLQIDLASDHYSKQTQATPSYCTYHCQTDCSTVCTPTQTDSIEPIQNTKTLQFQSLYSFTLIRSNKSPEKMDVEQNEVKFDKNGATLISHKIFNVNINNNEAKHHMVSEGTQIGQVFLKKNKVKIVPEKTATGAVPDSMSKQNIINIQEIKNSITTTQLKNKQYIAEELPNKLIQNASSIKAPAIQSNKDSPEMMAKPLDSSENASRPITNESKTKPERELSQMSDSSPEKDSRNNIANDSLHNESKKMKDMTHTSKQTFSIEQSDKCADSHLNKKDAPFKIEEAIAHTNGEFKPLGIYSQKVATLPQIQQRNDYGRHAKKSSFPEVQKEKRNQSLDQKKVKRLYNKIDTYITNSEPKNDSPFSFQPSSYVNSAHPNNGALVNSFLELCRQKKKSAVKKDSEKEEKSQCYSGN